MEKRYLRLSLALNAIAFVCALLTTSFVIFMTQDHIPRISATVSTKGEWLCINGLAYEFSEYGPEPEFGGNVEILEVVLEPKGSIQYYQGEPMPQRTGPKACGN